MAADPDSYELAVQQYVYWREMGLTHREMLEAVRVVPPRHALDAETVVRLLALLHRELMRAKRAA